MEKNPEMLEFVEGYTKADKSEVGGFKDSELEGKHPLLLQWDKRWGYAEYGGNMIAISGCGPTCLSMVVLGLTHKPVTPYQVAKFAEKKGYYVEGSGTSWLLMTDGADSFGVHGSELALDESRMKAVLDSGGMLILAMRPGDFTTEGHFIVIYGYDDEGFRVNDPNSVIRSRKHWTFDRLSHQTRNLWSFFAD